MFIKEKQKWDKFVIDVEKEMKLKDFLIDELGFSVRSLSKMKREKNIFVNNKPKKPSVTVYKDDIVEIKINEGSSDFTPQDLGIEVLYEDFDLIMMDKPPFMVVHPTKSHFENTLANAVCFHIKEQGESFKSRFVNRLDMNTSGIVAVAKNAYAHHKLSQDMSKNLIDKEYIAVVKGCIKEDSGTIDAPIYHEEDSVKRIIDERGQRCITHFKVVERLEDATVVRLKLETGRTHQIRIHLASISEGIIGDELYGYVDESLIKRQALHALKLELRQPRTKEEIIVKSNLPEDIVGLIEKLGGSYDNK